jgi:hypothetical protein
MITHEILSEASVEKDQLNLEYLRNRLMDGIQQASCPLHLQSNGTIRMNRAQIAMLMAAGEFMSLLSEEQQGQFSQIVDTVLFALRNKTLGANVTVRDMAYHLDVRTAGEVV